MNEKIKAVKVLMIFNICLLSVGFIPSSDFRRQEILKQRSRATALCNLTSPWF